ncbi:hypothetical protein F2P81_019506 [Scophthalmus maximus]|uniref:Uncharacterized protein n=1 Tax=Scophthalmus maximus TaxID=52904 RepID=A0A6A4S7B7_SCOMX|nr:hypothetical protein F2P81_019506 [Scophthalmus maximus]
MREPLPAVANGKEKKNQDAKMRAPQHKNNIEPHRHTHSEEHLHFSPQQIMAKRPLLKPANLKVLMLRLLHGNGNKVIKLRGSKENEWEKNQTFRTV